MENTEAILNQSPAIPNFWSLRRIIPILYEHTILRGLQCGLTKDDLRQMRLEKNYFHSPVCGNSLLLKIRIRLKLLKLLSYPAANLQQTLYETLEHFENINSTHWNPSLLQRESYLCPNEKYSMELHVIPSPHGFDWSKPAGLFYSLRNYLAFRFNHKIGHALIVLKKNEQVIAATGMTGETNLQVIFDLLLRWCGLEFLFRTFRGRLESAEYILQDIAKHKARGHIASMHFDLPMHKFQACLEHLYEWCENGYYRNYGLCFDAPSTKGASCTSYALNYLSVAGLLTKIDSQNWIRKMEISEAYFKKNKRIGLLKLPLLLLTRMKWASSEEKREQIMFYDPDLMVAWIRAHGKNA